MPKHNDDFAVSMHNNIDAKNALAFLSLRDYVTFQYMLSPPWIASQIVNNQVTSCTFYIVTNYDSNTEKDNGHREDEVDDEDVVEKSGS